MPTLLIQHGQKFRFYSSDGQEPPHIHVLKDGKEAKVWLRDLAIAFNRGYNDRELRELMDIVAAHREEWIGAWNEFFGI